MATYMTYSIVEIATFQLFFQLQGWTLPKLLIVLKNVSNESCPELNFLQKTQWKQIFISQRSGARMRQTFVMYWNWKVRCFLGLKASKIIDCIEKCFKQKLYETIHPEKCPSRITSIRENLFNTPFFGTWGHSGWEFSGLFYSGICLLVKC